MRHPDITVQKWLPTQGLTACRGFTTVGSLPWLLLQAAVLTTGLHNIYKAEMIVPSLCPTKGWLPAEF